jgi:hypothetical protein
MGIHVADNMNRNVALNVESTYRILSSVASYAVRPSKTFGHGWDGTAAAKKKKVRQKAKINA